MSDISRIDEERYEYYLNERKAFPGGDYDFTFNKRFLIYHAPVKGATTYYAIDKTTDLSTQILRTENEPFEDYEYELLIPDICRALNGAGYTEATVISTHKPDVLIDSIFRVILPQRGYTVREEQIALCKKIYEGLRSKSVSLCEAEVGTGKSLAYLVAAVLVKYGPFADPSSTTPITISTSSIELQNTIIKKEIPELSKMLMEYGLITRPLSAAIRKGKEHYFCRMRFDEFFDNILRAQDKYKKVISYMLDKHMDEGNILDLDQYELSNKIKDRICVKSCYHCSYSSECRYRRYISEVTNDFANLDFQVTNHHLYLMSLRQPSLLRYSDYAIIDEAHKLLSAAKDVFGARLSAEVFAQYLRAVKEDKYVPGKSMNFMDGTDRVKKASASLFEQLCAIRDKADCEIGNDSVFSLDEKMKNTLLELRESVELIERSRQHRLGKYEKDGQNLLKDLSFFLRFAKNTYWIDNSVEGKIAIRCAPRNMTEIMYNQLWNKSRSHVLTSGTMSDGRSFDYFKKENGIAPMSESRVLETFTSSPYNYRDHARLYMPQDIPFPDNSDTYFCAVADRIVGIVDATYGHTAILFTSYRALTSVYDLAKDRLAKYEVIRMGRNNKNAISDFKHSQNGVLFAAGSMWEGVDCIGDTLSSVIIVRLPFPIRSAALEEKKRECESMHQFIAEYVLPEMLIRLRQGAGRLIRCETDTGLISILDARASVGNYIEQVTVALDKYPPVYSLDDIRAFFRKVKPDAYFS